MSSIIPEYNYDIFISYRQKDNKYDGWVTEFVDNLKKELEATFKEVISVYFDINPHDGLLETHDVDESLKVKLKCLVFIPVISRTYCDPKSFAWEHEFKVFVEQASQDQFGLKVRLPNGNIANRLLPVIINDLDNEDIKLYESIMGGALRGVEFIYKEPGVNRSLKPDDDEKININKTKYRNQINKVALALKEIISSIERHDQQDGESLGELIIESPDTQVQKDSEQEKSRKGFSNPWKRNLIVTGVLLASIFIIVSLFVFKIAGGGRQARTGLIESVVILPFNNYTGADSLEFFVSGMHSSLIGEMGKISRLRTIGKTSSEIYKNAHKSVPQIAEELNVDAVIETDVMCLGDSICLQIRLISAIPEEKQLWIEDFREERRQALKLYPRITQHMIENVNISISNDEKPSLDESRSVDPEAYDAYLQGRFYLDKISPESLQNAKESFKKTIEIEPDWAAPYAGLAEVGSYQKQIGLQPESDIIIMIYENLNKALELDPSSVESHYTKAMIAAWTEFDWEKSEEEFLKAIELNPSHERSHVFYAHILSIMRRTDEALIQGKIAQELDPENPLTLGLYGMALMFAGECQTALTNMEKALSIEPGHYVASGQLYNVYECLGDHKRLFEVWKEMNYALWEEYGVAELLEKVFHEHGWIAVTEEAIRINEEVWAKDGHLIPMNQAEKYFTVGKYNKAMDYYEIAYENNNHDPNLPYISVKSIYDKLKDNPRYIALLKKMNLPVE